MQELIWCQVEVKIEIGVILYKTVAEVLIYDVNRKEVRNLLDLTAKRGVTVQEEEVIVY